MTLATAWERWWQRHSEGTNVDHSAPHRLPRSCCNSFPATDAFAIERFRFDASGCLVAHGKLWTQTQHGISNRAHKLSTGERASEPGLPALWISRVR